MHSRDVPANFDVIDPAMTIVLRQKTGAQRLELLDRLVRAARTLIETNIRAKNPHWNQLQISAAVSQRIARGTD